MKGFGKVKKIIYGFIVLLLFFVVGCGDSDNKKKSDGPHWLGAEIASLKEASQSVIGVMEPYFKNISEKKEQSTEPSSVFLEMLSSLEVYDQCLGERKRSVQTCYDKFAGSVNSLLSNLKTFFSDIDKVPDEKETLVSIQQIVTISSSLLKLMIGKYFKLEERVEHSHHVRFSPTIPTLSYDMWQIEDFDSKISYDDAMPYYERAIGLRLFSFTGKISKDEEVPWNLLQDIFSRLNTNQLKIDYSVQEIKSIWITKEIQEDDLKYASLLYAFHTWERLVGQPLFELKGALAGDFDLKRPDGKNMIMLKSSLLNRNKFLWNPPWNGLSRQETLGLTTTFIEFEEADIGLLEDSSLPEGYCYEESIYDFLPSTSKFVTNPEDFKKSLCHSLDDKRYNFVFLVLHELAHYLGYPGHHASDKTNLMYAAQVNGLCSYSWDGVVEKILEHQSKSLLLTN